MTNVTWTTIANGVYSGETGRRFISITSEADWKRLWAAHASISFPAPVMPAVDFNKEMVIAVFSGTCNTGGYSISIQTIVDDGQRLVVTFKEQASGGMRTQAFTQPFHMVRLSKSSKPVLFQKAV